MALKCQNCGDEIPTNARMAVEDGKIDEVVAHIQDGEKSFEVSQTDYYCNPECLAESVGE